MRSFSVMSANIAISHRPILLKTIFFGLSQTVWVYRAGVRHVRGVRPNRAADFRGPPILASFI